MGDGEGLVVRVLVLGGVFNPQGREEVKLYVGNLSFETTEESVRGMFEQHGPVTDRFLPTVRDLGRVMGFAFVTMLAKDAEGACQKVNGMDLDGTTIQVSLRVRFWCGGGD